MCLRLGFRLSVWYYRLVTKDYDFPVPMFVLPEHGENLYHREVLTLKQQLERQAQEKVQSQPNWKLSSKDWLRSTATLPSLRANSRKPKLQTKARLAALEAQLAAKMPNWRSKPNRNVRPIIKKSPTVLSNARWNSMKKRVAS